MKSIIIPAYNEEMRISSTILKLVEGFPDQEIVVICDGQDNSSEIVERLSLKYPNIRLISYNSRLGKGGALIEGFKMAKGNEIGFVDADESVDIYDLKQMFIALNDVDGVIASRRLKKSKILIKQPIKRRIASKAFNLFVRAFFGLPFKDTQCGAKVFKRDSILNILNDLRTSGFDIDVEILWRLKNKGYKIKEYPITWKHSEGSKFKLSQSKNMLTSLLKTKFDRR